MKAVQPGTTTAAPVRTTAPFFGKGAGQDFFHRSGNEQQFFSAPPVQTKLTVGKPDDPYEREADSMADKVVQRLSKKQAAGHETAASMDRTHPGSTAGISMLQRCEQCDKEEKVQKKGTGQELPLMRKPLVQRSDQQAPAPLSRVQLKAIAPAAPVMVQTKCKACEEKEKEQEEGHDRIDRKPIFESNDIPDDAVQRKCSACAEKEKLQKKGEDQETAPVSSIESSLAASKGSGSALPGDIRSNMESSFGADFSSVRIHTDSAAVSMNNDLQAQAFTHGSDIYFNEGKYDANSQGGQRLLAHELTHVVQQGYAGQQEQVQRYSWDEFAGDVSGAADAAGEAISDAGTAIADTAYAAGSAVADAGAAVYDYAASGLEAASDAALSAINWMATEAGQLAQQFVSLLGGTISISSAGISISLPRICPIDAMPFSHTLDAIQKQFMIPLFKVPVGPVLITGNVGLTGSITPEVQLQMGPLCLEGLHILINPLTSNYSISGSASITGAVALGAEVRGGVRGELGLETVIVVGGVPIPVSIPVLGVEGGLAGMVRGIGAGTFTMGGSLAYSGGTISATRSAQFDVGLAADLFAGAYAQLDVLGKNVCRIYWQPYEWHGGIAASLGLSADVSITTGPSPSVTLTVNRPTLDQIPFDSIPLAINREGFSDDCPIKDKICEILEALGLLPKQNGGEWDWGATGRSGTYGPGSRLPGPLDVYERNPGIPSKSTCRGACGPNCNTCKHHPSFPYTDPATGQKWIYTNFEDCDSHAGCRQHDAAFDWAADAKGETGSWAIIMPWHMAGNMECACSTQTAGNCPAWIAGLPPHDMKMFFAEKAAPVKGSGTTPPPGGGPLPLPGGGVTHSTAPIGEWGPDFYHYSQRPPSGDFSAGVERWTNYHTNCRAEANAATGVPDAFDYITVLPDSAADAYIDRDQFNTRFFTSIVHGIVVPADHFTNHTVIPSSAYTTTTLDLFTPDCRDGASPSNVPPGGSSVPPGGEQEEAELEQCDRGQLPPDYCDQLHNRVIERFGNSERNLNRDPDNDVDENRRREDDAPIMSSFRRMYNRLDSWDIFIRNRHPAWYPEFDSRFRVNEKREQWLTELKESTKAFKGQFRDVRRQDTDTLRRDFEQRILTDIQGRITRLTREIAEWYKTRTGSTEDPDALTERIHQEGTEIWRSAWRDAIFNVNRILSRLWPTAKARINGWIADQRRLHPGKDLSGTVGDVDYIGSLATGVKGAPKQFIRFNPEKFDVDANLQAPPLEKYAVNIRGISPDRGRIFAILHNTTITPLVTFCQDAHRELSVVHGYNTGDPFDVAINASDTRQQDRSIRGTERIYALRQRLQNDPARYDRMIQELRTGGLLREENGSWQLKPELTHAESVQLNEILRRYEQ